jgi:quinol-cytochrome oxidoreductase complex cytochrome b subunit
MWAITVGTNMARATPLMGHEGPGAQFLTLGGIRLVHAGDDVRFALLGGRFVGAGALIRFYVLHCVGIPFVATILMAVHFWRVRKDGGISGPL